MTCKKWREGRVGLAVADALRKPRSRYGPHRSLQRTPLTQRCQIRFITELYQGAVRVYSIIYRRFGGTCRLHLQGKK
jgi:hypothetical protein